MNQSHFDTLFPLILQGYYSYDYSCFQKKHPITESDKTETEEQSKQFKKQILLEKSRLLLKDTRETSCCWAMIFKLDPLSFVKIVKFNYIRQHVLIGNWDWLLNFLLFHKHKQDLIFKMFLHWINSVCEVKPVSNILKKLDDEYAMLCLQRFLLKYLFHQSENKENIDTFFQLMFDIDFWIIPNIYVMALGCTSKIHLFQTIKEQLILCKTDDDFRETYKCLASQIIEFIRDSKTFKIVAKIDQIYKSGNRDTDSILSIINYEYPKDHALAVLLIKTITDDTLVKDNMVLDNFYSML